MAAAYWQVVSRTILQWYALCDGNHRCRASPTRVAGFAVTALRALKPHGHDWDVTTRRAGLLVDQRRPVLQPLRRSRGNREGGRWVFSPLRAMPVHGAAGGAANAGPRWAPGAAAQCAASLCW